MTGDHVKILDRKILQDLIIFLEYPLLVFNETVTYRSVTEYLPSVHNITSHLKYTVASTSEYKLARRTIDLAIERHIKKVPT